MVVVMVMVLFVGKTRATTTTINTSTTTSQQEAFGPADNKSSRAVLVLAAAIIWLMTQTVKIAYTSLSCLHASRPITISPLYQGLEDLGIKLAS